MTKVARNTRKLRVNQSPSFSKMVSLKTLLSFVAIGFLSFIVSRRTIFEASQILNLETEKCPFCFSQTLCESQHEVNVEIGLVDLILGRINRKYVYFGNYRNQSIVIKRLASHHEVRELDATVENFSPNVLSDLDYFRGESLALLTPPFTRANNKLRLCPTLDSVNLLLERIKSPGFSSIHLWTLLRLNPEPLLLQVFKFEDGWPVPKYIGACGCLIVVENAGRPISAYKNHPWLFRVHVMEQLLAMAYNFTYNDPHFGIYFKDISLENVAINVGMQVRLIDLEHVIIVDKTTPLENQPSSWYTDHESRHFDCDNCITYSPISICNHRISDHNFYAVCKEFLSSMNQKDLGLLHSPSMLRNVAKNTEKLKFYVNECIAPSPNVSRSEIAKKFIEFLREMKVDGNFNLNEYKRLI